MTLRRIFVESFMFWNPIEHWSNQIDLWFEVPFRANREVVR